MSAPQPSPALSLLADWLAAVGEALAHALAGGVARPDPDLPDDLDTLAQRGLDLGLAGGAGRLEAAAQALRARLMAPRGPVPNGLVDALQRALAWHRLATRQLALARARAATRRGAAAASPPPRPRFSGDAWPVGIELDGEAAVIHARDADGAPVLVRDRLTLDADAPFDRPALSRLCQARLDLRATLAGLLRFDGHPIAARTAHGLALAPAFDRVPERLSLAPGVDVPRPGAVPLAGALTPEGLTWTGPAGPVLLADSPALALNAVKLALRGHLAFDRALWAPRGPAQVLLAAQTAHDGWMYPAWDPGAVRLSPAHLAGALADRPGDPAARYRLAAELAALGGPDPGAPPRGDAGGRLAPDRGPLRHRRPPPGGGGRGGGRPGPAARPHDVALRQAALGRPDTPPDGPAAWQAVALALADPQPHARALAGLVQAWASPPTAPGPYRVAARTLLLAWQAHQDAAIDDGDVPGTLTEVRDWFQAWATALQEGGLADPAAWLALGEAHAALTDGPFGLPGEPGRLLPFTAALVALQAGDAAQAAAGLALIRRAGLADWLVG
ncbi:MAG: hypothetical protein H6702_07310 [Myxococcales bacterium]|nr:hypothetical protein [Myxococcales bacterium]